MQDQAKPLSQTPAWPPELCPSCFACRLSNSTTDLWAKRSFLSPRCFISLGIFLGYGADPACWRVCMRRGWELYSWTCIRSAADFRHQKERRKRLQTDDMWCSVFPHPLCPRVLAGKSVCPGNPPTIDNSIVDEMPFCVSLCS